MTVYQPPNDDHSPAFHFELSQDDIDHLRSDGVLRFTLEGEIILEDPVIQIEYVDR